MSSSVIPGPGSVVLSVTRPYEDDGVTPRDDLIGMKVWVSLTDGFSPVNLDNAQVLAPIYDGPGLSCSITGLDPGVTYYVRYALVSSVDPDHLEASDQVACVPTESTAGESAITLVFSNESHTFPALSNGAISSYLGSGLQVTAFEGSSPLSASNSGLPGTFSVGVPTVAPSGIAITTGAISMAGLVATVAPHSAIGATMAVLTLTFPVTVVRADGTVMQVSRSQTLTKASTGATGTAGAAATAYWMVRSAGAIAKSIAGVYTPTAVTFSAMYQTGAWTIAAYAGRYIIATSTDGVAFTDQYTSAANEASKAYTVPAGIKAIRARLYAAGGVTTLLDEELVPVVTDGATGAGGATGATGTAGLDGAPGEHAVSGVLSNESHTVPADSAGVVITFAGAATVMSVFVGATDDSANWTFSVSKTNVTCPEATTSRTQTVTALTSDVGYVDITASRLGYPSVVKRFVVSKAKAGATGAGGATGATGTAGVAATAYWMVRSAGAIAKSIAGVYTPTSVTFSAMSQTGAGAAAAYAGRYIIATSTDGVAFTDQYTSAANEASKAYTVPAGIKAIRARLYAAGGVTTLLDEELVPVVTDGATGAGGAQGATGATGAQGTTGAQGPAGAAAVSAVLSNDAHTVPADSAGTVTSFAGAVTSMSVFLGTADDTANWTFSVTKTNVTCTEATTSRTQTVTAMSADAGYVDITASRSGYASVTKRFVVSKAKAGATGAGGATGATGSAGAAATAYWMLKSAGAIAKSTAGAYTPTAITFSAMSQTGAGAASAYAGRYIIATSTDGVAFTDQYTSAANEASKAYTVPAGIKAIRARLYAAGGVTTLLDEELVPVVTDGATGAQGPSVVLVASRAGSFTSTDGTLDASQTDVTFTALVNGIASPTFAWTFAGFQTEPTASTTNSQTITAAQFGTAKSATVKCTVNGNAAYVDMATVLRLEKSTAAAGANQTSVDVNGTIQGVSEGAGTKVSNSLVELSKEGILSGAGTSEQLDITYIPGALSADRIKTGVLSAESSITVGDAHEGVIIDGGAISGSVGVNLKVLKDYSTYVFSQSSSTPIPGYGTTNQVPDGWEDRPLSTFTNPYYRLRGVVSVDTGVITWDAAPSTISAPTASASWWYILESQFTFGVANASTTIPVVIPPGDRLVMTLRTQSAGKYYYSHYYVSTESTTYQTFNPVKIGKIASGDYGITGFDKNGSLTFKLNKEGLYLNPSLQGAKNIGISEKYKTLVSGAVTQRYTGAAPTSTGTVTSYVFISPLPSSLDRPIVVSMRCVMYFSRITQSDSSMISANASKFSSMRVFTFSPTVSTVSTVASAEMIEASSTSDGTNLAVSKMSLIYDDTGAIANIGAGPGIYLKVISRTMYDKNNVTYDDYTSFEYDSGVFA